MTAAPLARRRSRPPSLLLAGCGSARRTERRRPGVDGLVIPTPVARPGRLRRRHRQPVAAARAGQRVGLRGPPATRRETITVTVTDETREVAGRRPRPSSTTCVTDADGEVVEDTDDWFAQDRDGNVWYFGEARRRTWAGRRGRRRRQAGLAMPAHAAGRRRLPAGVRRGRGRGPGARCWRSTSAPSAPYGAFDGLVADRGHHPARAGRGRANVLRPGHRPGPRGDRQRRRRRSSSWCDFTAADDQLGRADLGAAVLAVVGARLPSRCAAGSAGLLGCWAAGWASTGRAAAARAAVPLLPARAAHCWAVPAAIGSWASTAGRPAPAAAAAAGRWFHCCW